MHHVAFFGIFEEVCEKLGIDLSLLAKVYESPDVTGYITKEVAELTGLPGIDNC